MSCIENSDQKAQQVDVNSGDKKPRIALIMKSLANDFFSSMAEGAKKHQQQQGDEYELIVNGIKDERDLSRQVALVEEMVANGVDAIVIAPADSKALVPALRRAREAGVVVVNIDNKLDQEILEAEKISIPFVGPDNQAGAKKVGDFLASKLKSGDEVVVLEGIRTSFNGTQRRLGFEAAMQDAGIKIVDSQSAQWEMSMANTLALSMLSEHRNVKAILAANDSMALGALAAVKNNNKTGEVAIVGFDNIAAVQQAIRDGQILATADQHGGELAVFGIEHALRLIEDPDAKVEDRETPVDLITAEVLK
ncbi:sugar ABC transporter substrate-binding protein [Gimesia aquarii]